MRIPCTDTTPVPFIAAYIERHSTQHRHQKNLPSIEVFEVSFDIYILCVSLVVDMGAGFARRDKESGQP